MEPSRLDISNNPDRSSDSDAADQPAVRPFLGIRFKCCRTYGRIYRNDDQTMYTGQCPKCRGKVSVPIGKGGIGARFFNAT